MGDLTGKVTRCGTVVISTGIAEITELTIETKKGPIRVELSGRHRINKGEEIELSYIERNGGKKVGQDYKIFNSSGEIVYSSTHQDSPSLE